MISGANIQQRFIQRGAAYATFFEDNYVADVLACAPGEVEAATRPGTSHGLGSTAGRSYGNGRSGFCREPEGTLVRIGSRRSRPRRSSGSRTRQDPTRRRARIVWHERFESSLRFPHATKPERSATGSSCRRSSRSFASAKIFERELWPRSKHADPCKRSASGSCGRSMLASAARLGHALIDLYVMTIRRLGSVELRAQESADDESVDLESARIAEYLDLLERADADTARRRGGAPLTNWPTSRPTSISFSMSTSRMRGRSRSQRPRACSGSFYGSSSLSVECRARSTRRWSASSGCPDTRSCSSRQTCFKRAKTCTRSARRCTTTASPGRRLRWSSASAESTAFARRRSVASPRFTVDRVQGEDMLQVYLPSPGGHGRGSPGAAGAGADERVSAPDARGADHVGAARTLHRYEQGVRARSQGRSADP